MTEPCRGSIIMEEFFQIFGISNPATERLKNSVRKAIPYACRRRSNVTLWVFPSKAIECMVAGSTTCHPSCSRETSNARVGGAVGRFQEDPPLASCFLANEPLDVPVQQLDGRNERVANEALISLLDDGWVAQLYRECSSSH